MFSLPRPRSSQLTTRAPALLTAEVAEWNFGASAEAVAAKTMAATNTVAITMIRRDLLMALLSLRDSEGSPNRSAPTRTLIWVGAEPGRLQPSHTRVEMTLNRNNSPLGRYHTTV